MPTNGTTPIRPRTWSHQEPQPASVRHPAAARAFACDNMIATRCPGRDQGRDGPESMRQSRLPKAGQPLVGAHDSSPVTAVTSHEQRRQLQGPDRGQNWQATAVRTRERNQSAYASRSGRSHAAASARPTARRNRCQAWRQCTEQHTASRRHRSGIGFSHQAHSRRGPPGRDASFPAAPDASREASCDASFPAAGDASRSAMARPVVSSAPFTAQRFSRRAARSLAAL